MATLIRTDGTRREVQPRSSEEGWQLDELYELLECSTIEVVPLDEDRIMIIDEEGKFQEPIAVNMAATEIARPFLWPNDFIAGHALVCASDELK